MRTFVVLVERCRAVESALVTVKAESPEEATLAAERAAEDHPDHWEWVECDDAGYNDVYRAHGAELGRDS